MDDPIMPSVVHVLFAVHRDLGWGDLERALTVCADADIRIRPVEIETPRERHYAWRAIPVYLKARYPVRVRHNEPEIRVRLGRIDLTPGHLAALETLLANATDETVALGIRVEIDPAANVEPALRLLMTVARRMPPEILLVPTAAVPAKLLVGDVEVRPVPGAKPAESPVTLPLTLDLR
jgi:hypothetical protein